MRLGLCLAPELAASWPDIPADYLEVNAQTALLPEAPEAAFADAARLFRRPGKPILAANCFLPGDLKVVGPAVDETRLLRYARTAFRRAAELGVRQIVVGSAGARRVPEGWPLAKALEQFVAALRLIGPLAAEQGVILAIEPLNRAECNLLHTVREGAAVVAQVGHPSVRLLADIYHMLRNGETAYDLCAVTPLLVHAHVAEKAERTAPGVAGDDFRPFLRVLRAAGYAGDLSIECNWGRDSHTEAAAGVAELRRQSADRARARGVGTMRTA